MTEGVERSKWGPGLILTPTFTLITTSKINSYNQLMMLTLGLLDAVKVPSSTSRTTMLATILFFGLLIQCGNSLKCYSCYSRDSCYSENILIKVRLQISDPKKTKVGGFKDKALNQQGQRKNKQIKRLAMVNGIVKEDQNCCWHLPPPPIPTFSVDVEISEAISMRPVIMVLISYFILKSTYFPRPNLRTFYLFVLIQSYVCKVETCVEKMVSIRNVFERILQ